jgi:hypothetical protein
METEVATCSTVDVIRQGFREINIAETHPNIFVISKMYNFKCLTSIITRIHTETET